MRSKVTRGVTLLSGLILFTLMALAALLVAQLFTSYSKGSARIDRNVRGDQVLTSVAAAYQQLDFEKIVRACTDRNAFAAPIEGQCLVGGLVNKDAGAVVGKTYDLLSLEVLRDADGEPNRFTSASGKVDGNIFCVDLVQCKRIAAGHMLEVTLRGVWPDPSQRLAAVSRHITFRRTRW